MITYGCRGRCISEWWAGMPAARYKFPVRFSARKPAVTLCLSQNNKVLPMRSNTEKITIKPANWLTLKSLANRSTRLTTFLKSTIMLRIPRHFFYCCVLVYLLCWSLHNSWSNPFPFSSLWNPLFSQKTLKLLYPNKQFNTARIVLC